MSDADIAYKRALGVNIAAQLRQRVGSESIEYALVPTQQLLLSHLLDVREDVGAVDDDALDALVGPVGVLVRPIGTFARWVTNVPRSSEPSG